MEKKILVIRSDRLGDVLLSLPSLYALRINLENEIHFMAKKMNFLVIDELLTNWNIKKIMLEEKLNFKNYYAIVFLYAPTLLLYKAWKSGVPIRIGTFSKLASFFLLNHGIIQHRSSAKKNEALYNMDLVEKLLSIIKPSYLPLQQTITIPENTKAKEEALKLLKQLGISGKFFICHPGSGGSALLIPSEKFSAIINALEKNLNIPVILSIGPAMLDKKYKVEISKKIPSIKIIENIDIRTLMEIFRLSQLVIAPSTGPLHLAHYVGTFTIGLYSPIRNECPERWAPYGGSGKSEIIYPSIECPSPIGCKESACKHYNCMEKLNWEELVLSKVINYGI